MQDQYPARIHVLLARDSQEAVVMRRGPSKQVCFIGWDRRTDTFKPTQWLKGRVYERRSDLSPDGRFLIYFAMNGKWESEAKGAWTAISRNPWMKAIALFAKGDCWHGGGLFLDPRTYWLNDGCGHQIVRQTSEVRALTTYIPEADYGGECPGVYYLRLQRDGWEIKDINKIDHWNKTFVFEKQIAKGWILRKLAHAQTDAPVGKGCYWDEHRLISRRGEILDHPDWEWADWDQTRILWAVGGCIYACSIKSGSRLAEPQLLYDCNDLGFREVEAPY